MSSSTFIRPTWDNYRTKKLVDLRRGQKYPSPPPKVKPMTAIVGFKFDGGILFGADTKLGSPIKTTASKIFAEAYGEGQCSLVFAVSAFDFDLAKVGIRDCAVAVAKINIASASMESIRNAIQSALTKFYRNHVFIHPDPSSIGFQFLLGIWLRGETKLYISSGTTIPEVRSRCECIGTGSYLCKYLIQQSSLSSNPTLDEVGLLTSYAVKETIEYDESVGGEVELLVLKNTGEVDLYYSVPIYPSDKLFNKIQYATWEMLQKLSRIGDRNELQCSNVIEEFHSEVKRLNGDDRAFFDFLESQVPEDGQNS